MRSITALLWALILATTCHAQDNRPAPLSADLVVLNAKVWTVNKKQPEAEAMAIVKDRIVWVGKTHDAGLYVGAKTPVLDLKGKRVVPGFHDSHVHLLSSGLRLSQVDL